MAITATPVTVKKLVLCKQLYNQAVAQSTSFFSIVNRITAVIGFDLAIETALKAAVVDLDPSKKARDVSYDLIQKCDEVLTKASLSLPDKANIGRVRAIRNDAQHEARYPNETDLNDCRVYTRDFLRKFMLMIWTLDFDKLSVVDLVQHSKAKAFLHEAENFLQKPDYTEAAGHAVAALDWALNKVRPAIAGRNINARNSSLNQEERRTLERMQDTLLFAVLGLNYAHYLQIVQKVGTVLVAAAGNVTIIRREGQALISEQEAEGIIAYTTDSVIHIERHAGNLDEPFGKAHWP